MDKSPDAFKTISEVAEALDLPQHVLRFWETRFNQIKPLKRGGGRRYYRPTDVQLLMGIRHLLYQEGYTIKGVQRLLRENGVQFAVAIGAGDMSALQEMVKTNAKEAPVKTKPEAPAQAKPNALQRSEPEAPNVLVGEAKPKAGGLFARARGEQAGQGAMDDVSRDNRTLLQEALFDLLECKRLLDQAR